MQGAAQLAWAGGWEGARRDVWRGRGLCGGAGIGEALGEPG